MSAKGLRSNVWMIDAMEYYLTNDLLATADELEYMKQVCGLKSKARDAPPRRIGFQKPSTIIDQFLYHGDFGHAQNLDLLKTLDIRHIINVANCPLNKDVHDQCNVLSINIDDDLGTDIQQHFNQTNNFLAMCKQKGEKVLVNCQMGISRSSSIVLAYLLKYHYATLHDAYDYLVQCRRTASPNIGFVLQLIRYEKHLNTLSPTDIQRTPLETTHLLSASSITTTQTQQS